MKPIYEANAEIYAAPLSVGPRADALQGLLDFHDFGELETDALQPPRPSIELGGLRFTQRRHHTTKARGHAPTCWAEDPAFPLQLLVTSDGDCVAYPASGCRAAPATYREAHLPAPPASDAWLVGVPAALITRWLRVTPATAAHRLDAESGGSRALCAYLHGWRFDELEALRSPFEKELIAEHVMGLLAMAISQHS